MHALVTGGAGFLGRHVARYLAEDGLRVTTFDRDRSREPDLPHRVGDLLDAAALKRAVADVDAVVHLGAIGDVYLAGEDPALACRVNVEGCANVAEAALAAGARVVYASTWEVYGEPQYQPLDERHPCAPDHPYNITKLAGERILMAAGALRGLAVVSLRIGTAYGTGMRSNSVFSLFADRARRGEPITIHGDGSQTRQFTHALDIARAFALATRSDVTERCFNVVADESTSVRRVAELICERYPTRLEFGEPRPGDVPPATADSQLAKRILGWEPEVQFAAGLNALLDSLEPARA